MNRKNDAQVVINGKAYNIAGYEDVEYLRTIAEYLNHKYAEIRRFTGRNIINDSEQNILMMINVADDYLKTLGDRDSSSEELKELKIEFEKLSKEVRFFRDKSEKMSEDEKNLRSENIKLQKEIVRLETELRNLKG